MNAHWRKGPLEWSDEYEEVRKKMNFEIGASPAMHAVFKQMTQLRLGMNVLFTGETGTGKSEAARVVNALLRVKEQSVTAHVEANIASLSPDVIQSELFGHTKGAFTGAMEHRMGRFEQANGGTLMLDEIGEIPMPTQVLLLSACDEPRIIHPLGTNKRLTVDLLAMAGTTRNLEEMVVKKQFHEALFERLSERVIRMPTLAERGEEYVRKIVPPLLRKLANGTKKVLPTDDAVLDRIQSMRFTGNARSLHFLLKAMALDAYDNGHDTLTESNLDNALAARGHKNDVQEEAVREPGVGVGTLADVEKRHILAVFEGCDRSVTRTAEKLDIGLRTVQRKLASYGMGADVRVEE